MAIQKPSRPGVGSTRGSKGESASVRKNASSSPPAAAKSSSKSTAGSVKKGAGKGAATSSSRSSAQASESKATRTRGGSESSRRGSKTEGKKDSNKTMLYAAIGGGVLLLIIIIAVVATRKGEKGAGAKAPTAAAEGGKVIQDPKLPAWIKEELAKPLPPEPKSDSEAKEMLSIAQKLFGAGDLVEGESRKAIYERAGNLAKKILNGECSDSIKQKAQKVKVDAFYHMTL